MVSSRLRTKMERFNEIVEKLSLLIKKNYDVLTDIELDAV